jgi:hypothetical protein
MKHVLIFLTILLIGSARIGICNEGDSQGIKSIKIGTPYGYERDYANYNDFIYYEIDSRVSIVQFLDLLKDAKEKTVGCCMCPQTRVQFVFQDKETMDVDVFDFITFRPNRDGEEILFHHGGRIESVPVSKLKKWCIKNNIDFKKYFTRPENKSDCGK